MFILDCHEEWCPEPISPINGQVMYTERDPGSVITFTCDEGYMLSTDVTQTCSDDLEWVGDKPECVLIGKSSLLVTIDVNHMVYKPIWLTKLANIQTVN